MTEELVLVTVDEGGYVNPLTGAIVTADSPDADIVGLLRWMITASGRIRNARREVEGVLLSRMDQRRKWTIPGAQAPSPWGSREWDVEAVKRVLDEMVDAGTLDAEAASACFRMRVEVAGGNLNAVIAGCEPAEAERLRACRSVESSRSVRITT